jgi:hypothetical protein
VRLSASRANRAVPVPGRIFSDRVLPGNLTVRRLLRLSAAHQESGMKDDADLVALVLDARLVPEDSIFSFSSLSSVNHRLAADRVAD